MLRTFFAKFNMLPACVLALFAFLICTSPPLRAQSSPTQTDADKAERQRAFELYERGRYTDAVPILEKLAQKNSSDVGVLSRLGNALAASSVAIKEPELRKQARLHAAEILKRAQSVGDNSDLTAYTLRVLAENKSGDVSFSARQEADKAMKAGEAAFTQGDYKTALAAYESALTFDPRLYEAPLFIGDCYHRMNQNDKAGEMYAKAIAINPDRETAYRYWGVVLYKAGRTNEAKDKFIEAFLADPYNRLTVGTLIEWAKTNGVTLANPPIDIPSSVKTEGNNTNITIDPNMLKEDSSDGSSAWMLYGLRRASWRTNNDELFRKAYPNETTYRHSLAEEAAALRGVIESLQTQMKEKRVKQLSPSLANLMRLDKDGLLESYILLARADAGIARDYTAYRRAHKDLLRRYVVEYVLTGGGK